MKKYAYMKCLFSSMVLVLSIYGFTQFYEGFPVRQADAQTCADIDLEGTSKEGTEIEMPERATETLAAEMSENPAETTAAVLLESAAEMTAETTAEERPDDVLEQPAVEASRELFQDALFIGDSRTVGLSEYADLGDADVFATIGLSSFKLFETEVDMPGYGKETLDEVLSRKNYGKIYLMLGINELGYPHASIEKQYREVVEKIREMQPDAILFLEASLHVSKAKSDSDSLYNNANIDWLNGVVESLCDQKQTYYIDVNEIFDDGAGNLDAQYTSDDAHPLGKYYAQWAEWILTKAIVKEK